LGVTKLWNGCDGKNAIPGENAASNSLNRPEVPFLSGLHLDGTTSAAWKVICTEAQFLRFVLERSGPLIIRW
jgi:hypothetical protein